MRSILAGVVLTVMLTGGAAAGPFEDGGLTVMQTNLFILRDS